MLAHPGRRTDDRPWRTVAILLFWLAGLTGVLAAAPGATAATSCPDADARPAVVGTARAATALACLVDHERRAAGLPPLVVETRAQRAAQGHADDMATRDYFAHDAPAPAPNGATVQDRLGAERYSWLQVGENIGRGQPTPRIVMASWLASPGHCANLMAVGVTDLGVGVATGTGGPYWVQVFARPAGVAAPGGPSVSCPRAPAVPAADGTTAAVEAAGATADGGQTAMSAPGGISTGSTDGPGPGATPDPTGRAATATTPVRVTARRTRRRVVVVVALPAGPGRAPVAIRVRQRGRLVRVLRVRLTRGPAHRLAVSVPSAGAGGRVGVRADGRTVVARFR